MVDVPRGTAQSGLTSTFTSCSAPKKVHATNFRFLFYSLDPTILPVLVFYSIASFFCFISQDQAHGSEYHLAGITIVLNVSS